MKRSLSLSIALANLAFLGAALLAGTLLLSGKTVPEVLWSPGKVTWIVMGVTAGALLVFVGVPFATFALAIVDLRRRLWTQPLVATGMSLAMLLVPILWVSLGYRNALLEERRVDLEWGRTLDPMETFASQNPQTRISGGALRLEAAAARLGIQVTAADTKGPQPDPSERKVFDTVSKQLESFVSSQLEKADSSLDPLPEDLRMWLTSRETAVTALVNQAKSSDPIVFETDWSSERRPFPPVYGLRGAHTVLLLQALERQRAQDARGAIDAISGSWCIGGALRESGELVMQLTAATFDGRTLGALRKLSHVPEPWRARISGHDYLMGNLRALQGEAWHLSAIVRRLIPKDQRQSVATRLFWQPIQEPYLRLMASNHSEALRIMVAELKGSNPCLRDPNTLDQRGEAALRRWNLFGRAMMTSLTRSWLTAARTSLELELTQKVLTARALEAEGTLPPRLSGLESSVCPGLTWSYETPESGGFSLSLPTNPMLGKPLSFQVTDPARN